MESLNNQFRCLINRGSSEAPLQRFLKEHPRIIEDTFSQGAQLSKVFPKFHLSDDFVPDFVMIGHRSMWAWDVDLIEIEPALNDKPLFTRNGLTTGRLRGAEAQINNWQNWMRKCQDTIFVPKALEKLKKEGAWDSRPEFYNLSDGTHQQLGVWYRIIIGRRTDFEGPGKEYQSLKWEQSHNRIEIIPWDRLLEKT